MMGRNPGETEVQCSEFLLGRKRDEGLTFGPEREVNKMKEEHKRFCDEYLIDLDRDRAYRAAYPACNSAEAVRGGANRLLKRPEIREYIRERREDWPECTFPQAPVELTEKQKRFCDEYLIDLDKIRAYREVYPAWRSTNAARCYVNRLLKKPLVAEYIRKGMAERRERVQVRQDDALRSLAEIAFSDVTDVVSVRDGKMYVTDTDSLPPEKRRLIAAIEGSRYGPRVRFWDRLRALELLCRHLGMFDRPAAKDELDCEEQQARIEESRARIEKLRSEIQGSDAEDNVLQVMFVNTEGMEK